MSAIALMLRHKRTYPKGGKTMCLPVADVFVLASRAMGEVSSGRQICV